MTKIKSSKPRKKSITKKYFVIINSDLKYFSGFKQGGKFRWEDKLELAKTFEDEHKFNSFKKWCNQEIIMDWVD